jgi:hypothetical protein
MHQRSAPRLALLIAIVGLLCGLMPSLTARAAAPGDPIVQSSGTVVAGTSRLVTIFDSGAANLMMRTSGPASSNTLVFSILSGSSPIQSWTVRGGETAWGYVDIPAGATLEIHNSSAVDLSYDFAAYARARLPAIADGLPSWSGVASGAGVQSSAQFDTPVAGLYSFTLAAASGSFQLQIDDGTILKTAIQGMALDPADATYFLGAGTHTFRIMQNAAAAQTEWSVSVATVGGLDQLPTSESTGALGAGLFSEEHIPIQVADAQSVNVRVAVTGAAADSAVVELYNGGSLVATTAPVHGGEVVWVHGALAQGANMLRVAATGANGAPIAYSAAISAVAEAPLSWAGTAYGAPYHAGDGSSSIQLVFPADGLYDFHLAAASGRFQFVLGDQLLRRTVDGMANAQFTAFVPAGPQTLTVVQAPGAATTSWTVEIGTAGSTVDTLPMQRNGSALGGPGDTFSEEWMPIQLGDTRPVNVRISVNGAQSDSVKVELFQQQTLAYSAASVFGGEVLWSATSLAAGTNLLHIVASPTNQGPVTYQVDVLDVPSTPASWSGIAFSASQNSTATFFAPVTGVYTLSLSISEGSGLIKIDDGVAPAGRSVRAAGSTSEVRVPLTAGRHTVTFQQGSEPRTVWTIEMRQRSTGPWMIALPIVFAQP